MTSRLEEALALGAMGYELLRRTMGESSVQTAEMQALRGTALAGQNKTEEAFRALSRSVPVLLKNDPESRGMKIRVRGIRGSKQGNLDNRDIASSRLSSLTRLPDTADEIVRLKLNADWIVLSACNTGAAQGAGAEAVSGLGRAFFYAGTRALLVSMWPVETTSAKRLTTGLFRFQKEKGTLTRAQALRASALDLMDNQVLGDKSKDKIVASYAHPFFWAPFIVVGDGGR